MLAHIRNGEIIKLYPNDKGKVRLENGDVLQPPRAGITRGNDKIVIVDEKAVYSNTTNNVEKTTTYDVLVTKVNRVTTYVDKTVNVDDVKIEANDRIINIMSEHTQRNSMAWTIEMITMYGSDRSNWPTESQTKQNELDAAWQQINYIRQKSNEIEQLNPIPANFKDDSYWT